MMPARRVRRALRLWGPVAAAMAVLFYTSVTSFQPTMLTEGPEAIVHLRNADKLLHFLAYGVLTALLVRALRRGTGLGLLAVCLVAVGWASGYGLILEVVQHFVGRTFSLYDALSNAVGASLAAALCALFIRLRRHRASRMQ
jgi:VanZ family protein